MKRFAIIPALALVFAAACRDSPTALRTPSTLTPRADAATTYTVSQSFDLNMWVWVPCAAGGAGETIVLTGPLHEVYHYTLNGNRVAWTSLDNPQGLSGIGLTTGDKYQGTGVTRSSGTYAVTSFPYEYTYVNNFRMIGQGSGNDYLVHETYHYTITANGNLTAYVDNFSVECR